MKKVVITLFVFLTLILAACGPAAPTPAVIEPTQAPTQMPEVVEPTAEPAQVPTNTTEPTAIPPTPTEEPPAEPSVFVSSAVKPEDLAEELPIYDVLLSEKLMLMAEGIALGGGEEVFFEQGFFTVFAAKELPEGVESLQAVRAMHYLIVPGLYLEADLLAKDGQSIPTIMEGQVMNITVKDGKVYLNDVAMVIQADILARNGVIHVIDTFLLPPAE